MNRRLPALLTALVLSTLVAGCGRERDGPRGQLRVAFFYDFSRATFVEGAIGHIEVRDGDGDLVSEERSGLRSTLVETELPGYPPRLPGDRRAEQFRS